MEKPEAAVSGVECADACRDDPVVVVRHVAIPMKDGVTLSARLWLPAQGHGEFPAIFEFIPYRKSDMVHERDARNHRYFAECGYACVRVDMRGSGDSEGIMRDMYEPDELADATRVIEWVAEQPWCDGRVGMMGTSWGGTASLQAAWSAPEALKAVIAVCATHDRFENDIHYSGGCMLTDTIEWGATLPAILAAPPSTDLPEIDWRNIWRNRLENLDFPLSNWLDHSRRDAYWEYGSVAVANGQPKCPVLAVGGWMDRYSTSVMALAQQAPDKVWGIVGPWGHHYPDFGEPGPVFGFREEAVKWWDHWLRGNENGVPEAPRLRLWRREYQRPANRNAIAAGQWIATESASPAHVSRLVLGMGANSEANASATGSRGFVEAPRDPLVGLAVGDTGYFGRVGGQPDDQTAADARSLCFETGPYEADVTLFGQPGILANVWNVGNTGQLAARLIDVAPDGPPVLIAWAVKNLGLDEENARPVTAEPKEGRAVEIAFPNVCYKVAKGHKLRVALSAMLWPVVWPSTRSSPVLIDSNGISLVVGALGSDEVLTCPGLAASRPAAPCATHPIVTAELTRTEPSVASNGTIMTGWHQPYQSFVIDETGLEFGYETRADHRIDMVEARSPVSTVSHRFSLSKGRWTAEIVSQASLEVCEGVALAKGYVSVHENGAEILHRTWSHTADHSDA